MTAKPDVTNSEHLQTSDVTSSHSERDDYANRFAELVQKYDEQAAELATLKSERKNWRVSNVCRELSAELAESRARVAELEAALADAMQYVPEATRTAIECERVQAAANAAKKEFK